MTRNTLEREPKVSIIILNWNRLSYLKRCIENAVKNTSYSNYEIIVFDNGSNEPGTKEYLSSLTCKVVMNPENLGFARGNNKAVRYATGEYLLFLNNDTIPHTNWLEEMMRLMLNTPGCGIVGSKLLYPDGRIQHIGVYFDFKGRRRHYFKGYNNDIPEAMEIRECEAVTGACMLIRRDLFTEVNGFDEMFTHGSEDIDLCLKVREKGHRVFFCPSSVLTHFEQVTSKELGKGFKKSSTRRNDRLFDRKWGDKLDGFRLISNYGDYKPYDYYEQPRDEILELVPEGVNAVLDVGCAKGILAKALRERGIKMIWGVELNPVVVSFPNPHLDKVIVGDIEGIEIPGEEVLFDCVIFADVLEHLKDPWCVLLKMKRYLATGGWIVASIPNIRHYKIVKDILRDRWLYREQGVLDRDHLRFFSLATIKNLFSVTGYEIVRIERSMKAKWGIKLANYISFGLLNEFLVQQYLILARKRPDKYAE